MIEKSAQSPWRLSNCIFAVCFVAAHFVNNEILEGAFGPISEVVYGLTQSIRWTQPFLLAGWAVLQKRHIALRLWGASATFVLLNAKALTWFAPPIHGLQETASWKRFEVEAQFSFFIAACILYSLVAMSGWQLVSGQDDSTQLARRSRRMIFRLASLLNVFAWTCVFLAVGWFLLTDKMSMRNGDFLVVPLAMALGFVLASLIFGVAGLTLRRHQQSITILVIVVVTGLAVVLGVISEFFLAVLIPVFLGVAAFQLMLANLAGYEIRSKSQAVKLLE